MFRTTIFLFIVTLIPLAIAGKKGDGYAGHTVLVTDFDGTLMSEINSPWQPYYILEKIESLHSAIQYTEIHEKIPSSFPITIEEFHQMEHLLGLAGKIKTLEEVKLKEDFLFKDRPLTIIPGYYTINESTSYDRFRFHENKNYLVEDLLLAFDRQKKQKTNKNFYGLTYDIASWLMKNPLKGDLAIHTARAQNHANFDQFFETLLKNDHLTQISHQFRLHALSSVDSRTYGRTLLDKKVGAIDIEVKQLSLKPIRNKGKGFIHVEKQKSIQGERENKHLMIVAEDHPEYADALFKKVQKSSQENLYRHKIKFVFIHAGRDKYIEDDKTFDGYRILVFNNGFFRPITDVELIEELNMHPKNINRFNIKYLQTSQTRSISSIYKNNNKKIAKKKADKEAPKSTKPTKESNNPSQANNKETDNNKTGKMLVNTENFKPADENETNEKNCKNTFTGKAS